MFRKRVAEAVQLEKPSTCTAEAVRMFACSSFDVHSHCCEVDVNCLNLQLV